jgi:hypothetical protein
VPVLSRRNLIVAALTVGVSLTVVHPSWAAEVMHRALPSGDRPTVEQTTTTAAAPEPSTTTEARADWTTTTPPREEPTTTAPVPDETTTEPTPPATEPEHEPTTAPKPPKTEPKHETTTTERKPEPTTEAPEPETSTTVRHEETHVAATFELRCERAAGEAGVRVVCRWQGDAPDGFSRWSLRRSAGDGTGRVVYTSDNPARREGTDSEPVDGPASYILFALNGDGKAIGHSQTVSV